MDKKLQFPGGEPDVRQNQLTIGSDANRPAIFATMKSYAVGTNPNYIISGCEVSVLGTPPSNTYVLSAGYIFLNNEILQVDASASVFDSGTQVLAFSKAITYDARGDKVFIDATPRQTWQKNRGTITAKASVLTTELDAINGDHIDDKLRLYIGESNTSEIGLVEKATPSESESGVTDKFIDAELMQTSNGKAWQAPSYNPNFSAGSTPLQYRINRGKLEMRGFIASTVTSGIAFILPIGYRPNSTAHAIFLAASTIESATISTAGEVFASWNNAGNNSFNSIIILD